MKTFKKILLWLLGILAVLIIVSFLLPKTYKVERTVFIKAHNQTIYDLTANFSKWILWVPWTKTMDSTAIFEIQGKEGEVGTIWKWNGKKMGEGSMTSTEYQNGKLIAYNLSFQQGKYQSKGKITIEDGDSCKVSWIDGGDLGYNPIARYMGLMMEKMMGPDFEKGLAKLKKVAEERDGWPRIEENIIPAQTVIMICDSAGPKEYGAVMGKAFGELYGFIKTSKLVQKGAPFAAYLKWDSVTYFSVMNICIPVEKAEKGKGRIQVSNLPEQKGVQAIYFGPYNKTESAYRALAAYIKASGKVEAGGPSEIYITNPMVEKDTLKWETHIFFPAK
ncbi:MAG: SRPBCC family protein [Bacteroidota bacterium]